ncbi:uncharacterized protein LOC6035212 [Culex quinquefasciatus]|uniref:uncharacterized protein LOC6035212 n=1 Tax=Culex quinquefasciatus TaxID=7176 RepID=UPI0018E39E56|nr:uncharacterized protein LOC6035212 [Culex quinquefasciatus]
MFVGQVVNGSQGVEQFDLGVPIVNFSNMSLLTPTTPGMVKDPVYYGESCPSAKMFYGEAPKIECAFSPGSTSSQSSYEDNNAMVTGVAPSCEIYSGGAGYQQQQQHPPSCMMMQQKSEDLYFKFDPEYIERMQSSVCLSPATTIATPLTCNSVVTCQSDYFNFNEVNCQSKNQSPCSSPPLDPWITSSLAMNFPNMPPTTVVAPPSDSPKHDNVDQQQVVQPLPSIKSAFGNSIQFDDGTKTGCYSQTSNYLIDYFDTSFLDQFNQNVDIGSNSNTSNADAYQHPEVNYNTAEAAVEKPNREFKDIWQQNPETTPMPIIKQESIEDENEEVSGDEDPDEEMLECLWTDCNLRFPSQGTLVAHIEKYHVEVKKGEEFACHWLECPRRYRPFNARYKLLIHMRVHSGEKPNKCPFSGCEKAFSRLENLKIHQRSHTGERPYNCTYLGCTKAFSNSSDRAKHQRTHYDTKPYACQLPGCNKRYTDPSSLRKHVKNHACRTEGGQGSGRRKSHKEAATNILANPLASIRRHSESSVLSQQEVVLTQQDSAIPVGGTGDGDSVEFEFDEVFEDVPQATNGVVTVVDYNGSSLNEVNSCFGRMMQPEDSSMATAEGKTCQDEYISYECVKNFLSAEETGYLGEYAMEQSSATDHTPKEIPPFEYDFFNGVV